MGRGGVTGDPLEGMVILQEALDVTRRTGDRLYTPQQQSMYLAARRAGMSVTLAYLPGGHGWGVGRSGLQANVAWLADRLGMTGGAR